MFCDDCQNEIKIHAWSSCSWFQHFILIFIVKNEYIFYGFIFKCLQLILMNSIQIEIKIKKKTKHMQSSNTSTVVYNINFSMHNKYDLTSRTQLINQNAEGYNPCFNMIIQDKKGKESNILRKGYLPKG